MYLVSLIVSPMNHGQNMVHEQFRKFIFTGRTSRSLGRYHRLQQICTEMIHGKCCVCALVWHNLQRGCRYLGRSHRLPHVCTISENQCPLLTFFLLPEFLRWLIIWDTMDKKCNLMWNSRGDLMECHRNPILGSLSWSLQKVLYNNRAGWKSPIYWIVQPHTKSTRDLDHGTCYPLVIY